MTLLQLCVSGGLLWLFQMNVTPTLLVSSSSGLSTMLQVVAAVIVALYVMILGSLFVIAQMATASYGGRTVPLLLLEPRVQYQLARALFLAIAAVLLSGKAPAGHAPSHALTAGVATIALATASLLPLSAFALSSLAITVVDARGLIDRLVLQELHEELWQRRLSRVDLKLDAVRDIARTGLQRRDRETLHAAVSGLLAIQAVWYDAGSPKPNDELPWVSERVATFLAGTAVDAIELGAPTRMVDRVFAGIDAGQAAAEGNGDERGGRAFADARSDVLALARG